MYSKFVFLAFGLANIFFFYDLFSVRFFGFDN